MIVSFFIDASQSISEIINFMNSMLFFNIFINISTFDMREKILSNEMIIYENKIIKKSLINLVEKFLIL